MLSLQELNYWKKPERNIRWEPLCYL